MKTKIYLLLAFAASLIMTACEYYPESDFYADKYEVVVNERIYFTNTSDNADSYEWDFGDGTISFNYDASHSYEAPGTYVVTLYAFMDDKESVSSITVYVNRPAETTLEITVVEYYDEYVVEDASIILYPTYRDWSDEMNMLDEQITNDLGIAVFNDLTDKSYYVDVWHPNYNNYALADDDVDFIRTLPLILGVKNTFIAYVDFIPSGGKIEAREQAKQQKMKIVDIKRTYEGKLNEIQKNKTDSYK